MSQNHDSKKVVVFTKSYFILLVFSIINFNRWFFIRTPHQAFYTVPFTFSSPKLLYQALAYGFISITRRYLFQFQKRSCTSNIVPHWFVSAKVVEQKDIFFLASLAKTLALSKTKLNS